MLFFYIFIFSSIVLGSLYVGPFSIRVYMTALMMVYLILSYNKIGRLYRMPRHVLTGFVVFIVITAIVLTLNGEYEKYEFSKAFLAKYLNCIVMFFAFDYFVSSEKRLQRTIWFLVGILTLNCFVTILQYYGNPIGKAISFLLISSAEVKEEMEMGQYLSTSELFGKSPATGIFNFTFINANYIAIIGVMIAGFASQVTNHVKKAVYFTLLGLFVLSCLTTQGRVPFFMLIVLSYYLFISSVENKSKRFFLLFFAGILAAIIVPSIISSDSLGRLTEANNYENDPRKQIWVVAISFIMNNFFLGGPVSYYDYTSAAPHNYFLNAFIMSGVFGAIVATFLFFAVLKESVALILSKKPVYIKSLGAAVLIYMTGSLFHNASIISGDTIFFVVYCLMLKGCLLSETRAIN